MSPKVAICASAHRPQNWMGVYNSIGQNELEFELVFVGPNEPDYELPKNFRFIRSYVKPSQCFEIAVRNCAADFIIHIADDCEFMPPQPLDKLYAIYKSFNNENIIVTTRFMQNDEEQPLSVHHFFAGYNSTIVVPISLFMPKKLYRDIGGIDRNFEAIFWEVDIAMRVYALGGTVVMSDVYVNEDKSKCAEPERDLWGETGVHDRALLESLWITDGKVHFNRKNPVEPFSDINILGASQGPRGRWRGNGFLLFEKIEDETLRQRSIPRRVIRGIRKPSMYPNYAKRIVKRLKGE